MKKGKTIVIFKNVWDVWDVIWRVLDIEFFVSGEGLCSKNTARDFFPEVHALICNTLHVSNGVPHTLVVNYCKMIHEKLFPHGCHESQPISPLSIQKKIDGLLAEYATKNKEVHQ
jgi:hypothetical protein